MQCNILTCTIFEHPTKCNCKHLHNSCMPSPHAMLNDVLHKPGAYIMGFYRPQGEGNVSTGVCLSTIGLMATRSVLGHVTARSVRILLECFLVPFVCALICTGKRGRMIHRKTHLRRSRHVSYERSSQKCSHW